MNDVQAAFIEAFNTTVREAATFALIVRARELQLEACSKLRLLLRSIAQEKQVAVESAQEEYANLLLGCECVTSGLRSEIMMWVNLKREEPDRAWDNLIDAQSAYQSATRAHASFGHLRESLDRLLLLEETIFPPQVFVSSGLIIYSQECSICGGEYEDCNHVVGRPYMGRFCCIVVTKCEADHLAIVDHPADKSCRILNFGCDGGSRNRMTWKTRGSVKAPVAGQMPFEAVMLRSR